VNFRKLTLQLSTWQAVISALTASYFERLPETWSLAGLAAGRPPIAGHSRQPADMYGGLARIPQAWM